jgi:hypothetical protein
MAKGDVDAGLTRKRRELGDQRGISRADIDLPDRWLCRDSTEHTERHRRAADRRERFVSDFGSTRDRFRGRSTARQHQCTRRFPGHRAIL